MAAFAAVNTQARTGDRDGAHVGQVKSQFKRWKRISTVRGKQDNNPQKQRSVQEVDDEESDDMFLVLVNVSGRKFELLQSELRRSLSSTLRQLHPDESCPEFLETRSEITGQAEYYLPRRANAFEAILSYSRGGSLCAPLDLCPTAWIEELQFYQLKNAHVSACCASSDDDSSLGMANIIAAAAEAAKKKDLKAAFAAENCWQRWSRRAWEITDGEGWTDGAWPNASKTMSSVFTLISMSVLVASVITFCIETDPFFRVKEQVLCLNLDGSACTEAQNGTATCECTIHEVENQDPVLYALEAAFIAWFTFELVFRFLVSPNKGTFWVDFLNWVDLIAILPFYITLGLSNEGDASKLSILRVIRLIRVFRVFKLSRHSAGLQIIGKAFYRSKNELAQLLIFVGIAVILFASAIFYCEYQDEDPFGTPYNSIPGTFWWAIVTMTTLGYGDMVPQTILGKIVGSLCAIGGIFLIAIPVPIFVRNYQELADDYHRISEAKERKREAKEAADKEAGIVPPEGCMVTFKASCCGKRGKAAIAPARGSGGSAGSADVGDESGRTALVKKEDIAESAADDGENVLKAPKALSALKRTNSLSEARNVREDRRSSHGDE